MENIGLNVSQLLDLYKYMIASRESDIIEFELVNSGEANFLASSKGHEGSVIIAPFLIAEDWLHCHYRDKALMLARGISNEMFFYSSLTKAESHSHGRQMVSHMSDRRLNIMSLVGPVGNNALQSVGVAYSIKDKAEKPIVLCCIGDGTSQQGEVLEAIAEAKRSGLPVLFFIHNNDLAISTRTKNKTFFSLPNGVLADSFYAIPITYLDGINPLSEVGTIATLVSGMRENREPQIVVFNVDRLDNHSNADDQKLYRDSMELTNSQANDPLISSQKYLLELGLSASNLEELVRQTIKDVRSALDVARLGQNPTACFTAERPLPAELSRDGREYRGNFTADSARLNMLEAIRSVLKYQLNNNENVYLFGEDIEDDKGDVFGITRGLSTAFPKRVKNSPLSESTIVGMSIGMSLTGKIPVAFVQFADFIPVTYNQIFSELATMYWRTHGEWECPVIVFAACGGYRPGLGPFHSQTNEATFAHIPGLDVYMPSNAADAAGMLNAAFKSGRPAIYLYPKKLLNNGSLVDTTSLDVDKQIVPLGKARIARTGTDITLVGWGNTVSLCEQTADILETVGVSVEVIDLRMMKPYDINALVASALKTGNLIVAHEDTHTCGMGGEILAAVAERLDGKAKLRRITRGDTYTPCNYINQLEVLPSYESILTVAAQLLNLSLAWETKENTDAGSYVVDVIGASPSDESVLINKIHVQVGDVVKASSILVDIEASKSSGEILSPCTGTVEEICVVEEERAIVGNPLLKLRLPTGIVKPETMVTKKAILVRRETIVTPEQLVVDAGGIYPVGISVPHFKTGSRQVTNAELLKLFPGSTEADILKRTGIENRFWLLPGESIIELATQVVKETLEKEKIKLSDINTIICATCTPEKYHTPSMACLILERLCHIYGEAHITAYDINAACSGYLYALQNAKDYLQTRPNERVLLITAEAISRHMDLTDFDTAFLFADAATATVLHGAEHIEESKLLIKEINLTSIAEDGDILNIPLSGSDGIRLQGKKLFNFAVKTMSMVMHKCCERNSVRLNEIELIIPHQANQRILTAVENRLQLTPGALYSNIAQYGNTSSCTIPIGLAETLPKVKSGARVALCAFGGGFTAGAALLTVR